MANTKTYDARKAFMDYYVYVPLGATKVAFEKSKEISEKAWKTAQTRRASAAKAYQDLAERGEKLVTSIRRSVYTKRAAEQTKVARQQVQAVGKQFQKAATSVRKAAGSSAEAGKAAVRKVG